jgi:hypothetical protein
MAVERAIEAHELVRSRYESGQSTELEFQQAIEAHNLAVDRYVSEVDRTRRSVRDNSEQRYNCEAGGDRFTHSSRPGIHDDCDLLDTRSVEGCSDAESSPDDNDPIPLEMIASERGPAGAGDTDSIEPKNCSSG